MPRPRQRHTATFSAMRGDLHPSLQPAGTYTYADGFTLRFAEGGGMLLTPEPPAALAALLPTGYVLVGGGRLPDGLTLLLLTQAEGPAGTVRRSRVASLAGQQVSTLFDDEYDPFGERLDFPLDRPVQVRIEKETEHLTRVYLNDEVNVPRCISLGDNANTGNTYSRLWSVHAFALQPTLTWGRIGFDSFLPATTTNLLSGHYRYSYRYRLGSTLSAPFPLSTSLPLRASQTEADQTRPVQMETSGVSVAVSLRCLLTELDTRWAEAELLVSYSPDGAEWSDLIIADRQPITTATLRLSLTRDAGLGETVPLTRLSEVDQVVVRAGAMGLNRHKLLLGDLELSMPLQPPASATRLSPLLVDMPLDEMGSPTSITGYPLAYTFRKDGQLTQRAYRRADGSEATLSLPVTLDFLDYKGTQAAHRRVGYRRGGETYPFALVLFDLLGQPAYAWPQGSFTTPNYYDNLGSDGAAPYAPTQKRELGLSVGPLEVLRPMGVTLDNLHLPRELLFDESGRLAVSGFAVVRGEASGRIAHQGIALPACWEFGGRDHVVVANPSFRNTFSDVPDQDGFGLLREVPIAKGNKGNSYRHLTGWLTYHCPDLLIDGRIEEQPVTTRLRLVGSLHGQDSQPEQATVVGGVMGHFYVKAYRYRGDQIRPAALSRPKVGDTTTVKRAYRTPQNQPLEKFYPEDTALTYSPGVLMGSYNPDPSQPAGPHYPRIFGLARQAEGAYLMRVDGYSLLDRGESTAKPAGYAIVNCEVAVTRPADQQIAYQWTNHFQPITPAFLAELPTEVVEGKPGYVVNGVDVWGGDTFLCRVDMARMVPFYDYDDGSVDIEGGFGVGMFLPLESRYNLALRYGRTYESVATMPTQTARGTGLPEFRRSINVFQAEDWNLNAGLRVRETVRHFATLPDGVRLERYWPQGVAWSRLKTDGERFDSYRRLPASNLYLLEGEHGKVTGLVSLLGGLYAGQERAFSRLPIDERQVVASQNGEPLTLAQPTGRELGPADYISTSSGWQRPQHHWLSGRAIYFLDARLKKWMRFSQAGLDALSDRDGLHNFLLTTELTDWSGAFDFRNDDVHLLGPQTRVVYNEAQNAFITFDDPIGTRWIHDGGERLLAQRPLPVISRELLHTGRMREEATLRFVVNPMPGQPKQFVTGILSASRDLCDRLTRITLATESQSIVLDAATDERIRWREGRLWLPLMTTDQETPLRGSTLTVQLDFASLDQAGAYWLLKWETDFSIPFRP